MEKNNTGITEKVTNKVANQVAKIITDKIREVGEFSCEEMNVNISFKNMKISAHTDNEYEHKNN